MAPSTTSASATGGAAAPAAPSAVATRSVPLPLLSGVNPSVTPRRMQPTPVVTGAPRSDVAVIARML